MTTIVRGGTLIDGRGGAPETRMAVVIEGDRISKVAQADAVATGGAEVIDADGKWIMPGLINMHDHLMMRHLIGNPRSVLMEQAQNQLAMNAVRNGVTGLRRGWTTVRDMGASHAIGLDFRGFIADGHLPGPRVVACGSPLSVTGGHAWPICVEVDGPAEARRAARRQLKAGADFIKVMASHDPVPMPGPEKTQPEMGLDEIRAAFDEAKAWGRKTACHVMGTVAIERVLDAGVDVISHGFYMNDDLAHRAAEQGVYLDPTLSSYGRQTMSPKLQRGAEWARIHMWLLEPMESAFRAAVRAGVKIVTGTDTAGQYPEDVAMMRELGLDPMASLLACTNYAAEALGLDHEIGTVEAGKLADLVLLDADPLADAYALDRVHLVIKQGAVWRPDDITLRSPL